MKEQQKFEYRVYDSMNRRTEVVYYAYNMNEAFKAFREDSANYRKYSYFGKLIREYNRGYHISEDRR